jgi:anti-sigma regulatory factor (Ser/Thr protein kinase)
MANEFLDVRQDRNRIKVYGDLRLSTLGYLTSAIHQTATVARYPDIVLDFKDLSTLTHSVVPPLASYLRRLLRDDAVDFQIIEPRNVSTCRRLIDWGLAHYVEHRKYPKPKLNSSDPALIQFLDEQQRNIAVDKVLNAALRTAKLERQHVAALEWAVNEITDNVLSHSRSKVGGFLISHRLARTNIIEFTVADSGIGISKSLGISDEREAVERAIQEGVTRNTSTNQGNGLFGTYRLALVSSGIFVLKSLHGNLFVEPNGSMHIRGDNVPYNGTYVVCQVDCDRPDLIERAFIFDGRPHTPATDFIDKAHGDTDEKLVVKASDICKTFGSRTSGLEARQYISNLLGFLEGGSIEIDFSGVNIISSSFADEVFGKLFVELGPLRFMRLLKISNAPSTIEVLVDRAITLRSQTGL